MNPKRSIYIYILKMSNNKYYTGITQDLSIRMKQHDKGYSKSTKWHRPLKLIFATIAKDRQSARRLEVKIKNISAKRYLLNQRFRPNRPYSNIL
jgi:putative endonuclease